MLRTHRRHFLVLFTFITFTLSLAAPSRAQEKPATAEQIRSLEQKLNQLLEQAGDIRKQLDSIKGTGVVTAPAVVTEQVPSDDLLNVEPVPQAGGASQTATADAAGTPSPTPTGDNPLDAGIINNPSNPGASKAFNPDTSVIGNFIGHAGNTNPFEDRKAFNFDEAEIAFEAFIDPYAKGKFFFSVTPGGIDLEEGFANFIALPIGLTAKVGKMKAMFGKDNTWHTHVRPWVDQPLVIKNFFGEEGLNDTGISVSRLFPNSHDLFVEATGEVFRGDVGDVFKARNQNDLFYNGHLKLFRDVTENSNIEFGTSLAKGSLTDVDGSNVFGGLDVTYRWKPLGQATRRSFISRTEVIGNDRQGQSRKNWGFYTAADYQLGQRWFTGVRLDRADRPSQPGLTDEGASLTLTFWPSEFSQIRGQLRHMRYEDAKDTNELLLQLQFAIGAHGAHVF